MSLIKTSKQVELMAESGRILREIILRMVAIATPGVTTQAIDDHARALCKEYAVTPGFFGYGVAGKKYPAVSCLSVNDAIVHAIPTERPLQDGDVLGIDMGVVYKGWNSDSAVTVVISHGNQSSLSTDRATYSLAPSRSEKFASGLQQRLRLVEVTRDAMYLGIAQAVPGNHVGDIGHAVQKYVEAQGFGVIRDLVGHGIGKKLHEEPRIPNYGLPGEGHELKVGMVICIEPMVSVGDWKLVLDADGWTYRTKDGSLGAHFEHTLAITKDGPVVLT